MKKTKTDSVMDKWLVIYDDGQEILDAKIAQDRFGAMEDVRDAGEKSGGEIGASVVHLPLAAGAPALLEAAKYALKFIKEHEARTGKTLPYSFYATQSLESAIRKVGA